MRGLWAVLQLRRICRNRVVSVRGIVAFGYDILPPENTYYYFQVDVSVKSLRGEQRTRTTSAVKRTWRDENRSRYHLKNNGSGWESLTPALWDGNGTEKGQFYWRRETTSQCWDRTGRDERELRVPLSERHGRGIVRTDVVWDANRTETRNEYLYGTDRTFSTF